MEKYVQNDVKKSRKMTALILILLIVIITTVAVVIMTKERETEAVELAIDGSKISEDEFLQAIDTVKYDVTSYFISQYNADIEGDFWTRDYEGDVPCRKLAEAAVEELRYRYAVYAVAEEKGYLERMSYADKQKYLEQLNEERKAAKEAGEVIYGLVEYSMEQYLDYELNQVEEAYCNDSSNADMEVADEEAGKYYESNGDMISESGEIIPLDTVRSAVDNEIRQLRYAEMIEERAESLKVEADEEQLFAFIVNHI